MSHLNCKTVGQRDFSRFLGLCLWLGDNVKKFSPTHPHTPKQSMFCLFSASSNVSFGLVHETMHRFNGCAKIWSAPGKQHLDESNKNISPFSLFGKEQWRIRLSQVLLREAREIVAKAPTAPRSVPDEEIHRGPNAASAGTISTPDAPVRSMPRHLHFHCKKRRRNCVFQIYSTKKSQKKKNVLHCTESGRSKWSRPEILPTLTTAPRCAKFASGPWDTRPVDSCGVSGAKDVDVAPRHCTAHPPRSGRSHAVANRWRRHSGVSDKRRRKKLPHCDTAPSWLSAFPPAPPTCPGRQCAQFPASCSPCGPFYRQAPRSSRGWCRGAAGSGLGPRHTTANCWRWRRDWWRGIRWGSRGRRRVRRWECRVRWGPWAWRDHRGARARRHRRQSRVPRRNRQSVLSGTFSARHKTVEKKTKKEYLMVKYLVSSLWNETGLTTATRCPLRIWPGQAKIPGA